MSCIVGSHNILINDTQGLLPEQAKDQNKGGQSPKKDISISNSEQLQNRIKYSGNFISKTEISKMGLKNIESQNQKNIVEENMQQINRNKKNKINEKQNLNENFENTLIKESINHLNKNKNNMKKI